MKTSAHKETQAPFEFVIEELLPMRPVVKNMFGFCYVYVGDRLMLLLRNRTNQPRYNGVWLATAVKHFDSLKKEFPVSPPWLVGFAKKQWLFLPLNSEGFEEYALKACELILRGDDRMGRLSRPKNLGRRQKKGVPMTGDDTFSLFRSGRKTEGRR